MLWLQLAVTSDAARLLLAKVDEVLANLYNEQPLLPDVVGRCMALLLGQVVVILSPRVMSAPNGCDGYVTSCSGQVFAPPGVDLRLHGPRVVPNNQAVVVMNVDLHFAAVPLVRDLKLQVLPGPHNHHCDLLAQGRRGDRVQLVAVAARHWLLDVAAAFPGEWVLLRRSARLFAQSCPGAVRSSSGSTDCAAPALAGWCVCGGGAACALPDMSADGCCRCLVLCVFVCAASGARAAGASVQDLKQYVESRHTHLKGSIQDVGVPDLEGEGDCEAVLIHATRSYEVGLLLLPVHAVPCADRAQTRWVVVCMVNITPLGSGTACTLLPTN